MKSVNNKYKSFYESIKKYISNEYIYTKDILRLTYGADASLYRMIPEIVIKAKNEYHIQNILNLANKYQISVTFRAAGTSLSGQAITDSVLVLINDGWDHIQLSKDYSKIRMQAGVIGSQANQVLFPYKKKIGPDPASLNAAMIGGIVANNASGMRCGVNNNSYKTITNIKAVLYDGTLLDTTNNKNVGDFKKSHKILLDKLNKIKCQILNNEELVNKIINKYRIKNTNGYSLNSFLDYNDPIDILKHIMVGSEGTLGFISEVELETIPIKDYSAISIVYFESIKEACSSIISLDRNMVTAAELMSRHALRTVENKATMPSELQNLPESASALLLETSANSSIELKYNIERVTKSLNNYKLVFPVEFTDDDEKCNALWKVRDGLSVSNSNVGDTAIGEDIAVPLEHLPGAVDKLQAILSKYEYDNAIVFGHALDGNIHFDFTQNFSSDDEVSRYKNMMDEVCRFVVRDYNGSLKAEHSTGRNMAPYLRLEWGDDAYDIMIQVKNLLDPFNILNKGVIFNEDNEIHIKNLKPMPPTNSIIDNCIECGFCEQYCPSHKLTLSPRQRIVALREVSRLEANNEDPKKLKKLRKDYSYYGEKTCATDGLCEINCPVSINTGVMTKEIRCNNRSYLSKKIAECIANNLDKVIIVSRQILGAISYINTTRITNIYKKLSKILYKLTKKRLPIIDTHFPKKAINNIEIVNKTKSRDNKIIYFPSCVSRIMGPSISDIEKEPLSNVAIRVMNKCGYDVVIPDNIDQFCCGTPFASKGYTDQADYKAKELLEVLYYTTEGGKYDVVFDTSPCAYRIKQYELSNIKIYDPVEFAYMHLIDKINKIHYDKIAIHPTCSTIKSGNANRLKRIAELCSTDVIYPSDVHCCGYAGDKGMYYPELTSNALRKLHVQVRDCQNGFSTSKTCELGLSQSSNIHYKSIFYMLDKCIRV